MANKEYVIMWDSNNRDADSDICPVVPADNKRKIIEYQRGGYRIISRVKCDDDFIPCVAEIKRAPSERERFYTLIRTEAAK